MTEAVAGAERERLGVKVGFDVGWGHAGAVVFDGELQAVVDDGEGDTDLAGGAKGNARGADLIAANGLGCIAHQVDGDALDDLGGEGQGRKRDLAGDGDLGRAGGDAPEDRREAE